MKIRKNIFLHLIILLTCIYSCNKKQTVRIVGDIPNLPDGIMYLWTGTMLDKIDSVQTIKGHFEINHDFKEKLPIYIGIFHRDKKNVQRVFGFITNVPKWGSPTFMSDPLITIKGNMEEYTPVNFTPSPSVIFVNSPRIKAGKQTEALYNTGDAIFTNNSPDNIDVIKEKIKKYPYSYHILYNIIGNKTVFNTTQTDELLNLFDEEVKQSNPYKKLLKYNNKAKEIGNIKMPELENSNGKKVSVLDKNYKKHLLVFWASWCGPCRMEIPMLKKEYEKYNKDVEFISISIDEENNAWKKALSEEKMSWKQFIINSENPAYNDLQILFKFNNTIPYTILIDNNMKVLSSSTGLSSEEEFNRVINK
ncbi:TlpA family protein disulfide reductase [Chryseobacterium viscerum]|uniref:TlpA family protein disulfide reductase n=1 Tax=Chryseobacterium viscerum TaxID=1037377 RepID=A0A316WPR3_9FLAO|nr:TlpA disulfide reductase family protein [Chryseobacterium viscerum]PWN62486.1 TlpA family protein disulfide reductase [Chryseobacterium viscerum]